MSVISVDQYAIGIDIGGTSTKFGIVSQEGKVLYKDSISSKEHLLVTDFVQALYEKMLPAMTQFGGVAAMKGIGVGAPNGNYYTGTLEYAPNLLWKGVVPMAAIIEKIFGLPTVLTNDANAAALGEMKYGAARGMQDFIEITLGTGVGSGIVINGQMVYGHDGFAGELGHTIIIPGGRKHWATGHYGSLEAYASATGVVLTAIEFLENNPSVPSCLRELSDTELDSKAVYEAAMQGDSIAQDVYSFTGEVLGKALANFVMFSSPEAIVLFGGLTQAGELLLVPTKEHLEKALLPIFQNKVKLLVSELNESDAAILGGSAMVWKG